MKSTKKNCVVSARHQNKVGIAACMGLLAFICSSLMPAYAVIEYDVKPEKEIKRWSGYVNAAYTRNVYSAESYHAYEAYNIGGRVSYRTDWGNLMVTVGGEQETLHGKESSFYDPFLEYRTPTYHLSDTVTVKGSAGVYLPASRYSKRDNLQYAPRVGAYVFWSPLEKLRFFVSPRYRYNAYQYKTGGRRVLIEHQFDTLVDAFWMFNSNLYLEVSGRYRMSKNYYGRRMDDSFTFAQELGWQFNEDWVLALGHNNSGGFYHPEIGPSKGFDIYNKKSSTFYLSLTKYL